MPPVNTSESLFKPQIMWMLRYSTSTQNEIELFHEKSNAVNRLAHLCNTNTDNTFACSLKAVSVTD